jgi:cell division protein FtsI/penicillin-binding protein 2
LAATSVDPLRTMMREVVTKGTATALADVPGGAVHGKTGTAEFGRKDPPDAHAWFTGYQGDVAFAVVVEGGGFGAKVAAPIAGAFLGRLAR